MIGKEKNEEKHLELLPVKENTTGCKLGSMKILKYVNDAWKIQMDVYQIRKKSGNSIGCLISG